MAEVSEEVRHALGGKHKASGKWGKAHTHAMHIERSDNGGFVAKHDMRHHDGSSPRDHNPHHHDPTYTLSDLDALKAHVGQSMAPPDPNEAQEPPEPAGQPEAAEPDEGAPVAAGGAQ